MDEKVEYFVAYEKEHFENISMKHKDQMKNIRSGRKFNVKWALPLEYFGVEIVKNDKENKVYDNL